MKRLISTLLVAMVVSWAGTSATTSAETSSSIVGTWQVTSSFLTNVGTNEVFRPLGRDDVAGYIQYSPGGHVVVFLSLANLKKPTGAIYTDADRADLHKGILGAYAGSYTVDGNKVTHHVVASWRPDWIGDDQVRFAEISGNKLAIKSAPFVFPQTGKEVINTLTFERVD
jgi:Lipocalin-like domain